MPTSSYMRSFERMTRGLAHISVGLWGLCRECAAAFGMDQEEFASKVESGEAFDEGGFSWQHCDTCGSGLGGMRYAAHAFDHKKSPVHLDVCGDCLNYIANGDEPESWEG